MKALQDKLFEIESTTKLTTRMINSIVDSITLWLSEKGANKVEFPNKDRLNELKQ